MCSFENSEVHDKYVLQNVFKIASLKYLLLSLRSRTEISSLGSSKKGWQKVARGDNSSSALILSDEIRLGRSGDEVPINQGGLTIKPRTPMELERDIRKVPRKLEKCRFLYLITLPHLEQVSFMSSHFLMTSLNSTDIFIASE